MTRLVDIGRQIRDDIATGRLALGARLTIDELAGRYGASHMPIREALRQLQGEGLIELEQNRGARVRSLDRGYVVNLFETRSALEVVLARQAARHIASEHLAELHRIEAERSRHAEQGEFPEALRLNRRFHQLINTAAANPQAVAIVDQHWVLLAALWHRHGYGPERFAGVSSDHRNLLRAFAAQDVEAAAALMHAHVIKAKYDLLQRIDATAEPGVCVAAA